MTKILQPQSEYVDDTEQQLLEIEEARLAVKFGNKRRFSAREYEAIDAELIAAGLDDAARRDPGAVEAVFRKLNQADEVANARRMIMGPP
jgi:hypothetical protein